MYCDPLGTTTTVPLRIVWTKGRAPDSLTVRVSVPNFLRNTSLPWRNRWRRWRHDRHPILPPVLPAVSVVRYGDRRSCHASRLETTQEESRGPSSVPSVVFGLNPFHPVWQDLKSETWVSDSLHTYIGTLIPHSSSPAGWMVPVPSKRWRGRG